MATKRMLVDATHPEETRIVVTSGNRLEEFDFESAERRQLRGNIYLAKVTRVEPSLQAAFVEYGGNRHGFLAFSEIHPDYYQIPVADREALMRAEEEAQEAEASEDDEEDVSDPVEDEDAEDGEEIPDAENGGSRKKVEQIGEGDALEDLQERPRRNLRKYKIQEVIKRRQVLLVQVVKEERGNKGAALTTYLSLAGRYSVLMPNTARGGGISRKITSAADRKRLKEIATDLDVPQGMGVILRTAGASRTKAEVKRDFEYLMRLWENVRTLTLESSAPCLVYEEGSLIKRTIRDLYNKDIGEVLVAGDAAYREAKDFMRMIMPSHSKNVQAYKDDAPIFSKYNIESQLDSMFHPQVTLPSGGYIVINPTEALVSIDVNSGRATKEHNIEDTALQTNLEAAEEISRQLRLRDLAGLIVIDFIDMEEKRNNRAVERKLKDCLKNDRARIQVGHISHFGLLEMSRQRIRFGVLESSTHSCPTCAGTGLVRSVSSLALMIMRAIEDHVLRKPGQSINVNMPAEVALYILNTKRHTLSLLEEKYGLSITISASDAMVGNQFTIERGESRGPLPNAAQVQHIRADAASMDDYDEAEAAEEKEEEAAVSEEQPSRSKRRRRRRRGTGGGQAAVSPTENATPDAEDGDTEDEARPEAATSDDDDQPRKRRRRGRRGGRRNRRGQEGEELQTESEDAGDAVSDADAMEAVEEREAVSGKTATPEPDDAQAAQDLDAAPQEAVEATEAVAEKPKRGRRSRKKTQAADTGEAETVAETAPEAESVAEEKPAKKPRKRTSRAKKKDETPSSELADSTPAPAEDAPAAEASEPAPQPEPEPEASPKPETSSEPEAEPERKTPADEIVVSSSGADEGEDKPKKVGWWQRRLGLG
ncbi:Rne/Rng family ribonuclease [Pelagibacterium xiamenense]|uniref:Rne/Rng family ribonuclease n=1 Tax=Pelagibacterium xiamenense TaxID=2901140 RepID=UPI001E463961|nr:Rne/Rng family ribonuclease [Pelagibacterium xiamenense]MCD7061110.1 ribonuclease E/G [Pelagibacterium xiamenense]